MTVRRDPERGAEKRRLLELLDRAAAAGQQISFWWRDDDAETVTPALDRLLRLRARYMVPLALAVVPRHATEMLAERVRTETGVYVLQHGWQHRNHAPEGEKKAEIGAHRQLPIVIEELRSGFDRLSTLFRERFLPVLVPPWNRVSDEVSSRRADARLLGLSVFGRAALGDPQQVNTHLDIFEWRPARRPIEGDLAYATLAAEIERRLGGDPEPVGIMTHHLVHDDQSWALLDELLPLLAKHPAVRWPPVTALFGFPLSASPDSGGTRRQTAAVLLPEESSAETRSPAPSPKYPHR